MHVLANRLLVRLLCRRGYHIAVDWWTVDRKRSECLLCDRRIWT